MMDNLLFSREFDVFLGGGISGLYRREHRMMNPEATPRNASGILTVFSILSSELKTNGMKAVKSDDPELTIPLTIPIRFLK